MLGLIWFIIAIYLVFAATATLLYWYEAVNNEAPPFEQPKPGIFTVLRSYFFALGGYAVASCLVPVGLFFSRKPSPLKAERDLAKAPLILVHGIHDSPGVWLYLTRRLEKKGRRVTIFGYLSLCSNLDGILTRLDDHIHMVEAAFPGKKPVFVVHSLGGLLVRKWLMREGNAERAGGVITMGTPHRGSKVAAVFSFGLGKHIAPRSAFIRDLVAHEDFPLHMPRVSLVSPTDEAVQPASSLMPPAGWRMRLVPPVSHFGMLVCPRTAAILDEELAELEASTTPGAATGAASVAGTATGASHGSASLPSDFDDTQVS